MLFLDLAYYGVLMLAQKACSQFADGEGTLAMWKNSMSDYHQESKVLQNLKQRKKRKLSIHLSKFCLLMKINFSPSIVSAVIEK